MLKTGFRGERKRILTPALSKGEGECSDGKRECGDGNGEGNVGSWYDGRVENSVIYYIELRLIGRLTP